MFDRSRLRSRWWLYGLIIAAITVLALTNSQLRPVRDVATRLALPVLRPLSQAGNDLNEFLGSVNDLATLRQRNTDLEQVIANLTVENLRLREVEEENTRLRKLLNFAQDQASYGYKGSQVVGRVISNEPNYTVESILIDLGSKHGIMQGMPVVTERGLVGRISQVYTSTSRVILLTDSSSSVNVILQNARTRGVLLGHSRQMPIMDYLPPEQNVSVGDIVLTSGEGGAFPNGIPVGQVTEVQKNDVDMFQRAIVRTTVDFNTLETVLVVTSFTPNENLENLPER